MFEQSNLPPVALDQGDHHTGEPKEEYHKDNLFNWESWSMYLDTLTINLKNFNQISNKLK